MAENTLVSPTESAVRRLQEEPAFGLQIKFDEATDGEYVVGRVYGDERSGYRYENFQGKDDLPGKLYVLRAKLVSIRIPL
jgi:hypothetical protein